MSILGPFLATLGGSGDVTEDSIDWANISGDNIASNANQTFNEIDSPIDVSWSYPGASLIEASKNDGTFSTSEPVSVSNGDTLRFRATTLGGADSGTVTVTNDTDASTLDTFTVTMTGGT